MTLQHLPASFVDVADIAATVEQPSKDGVILNIRYILRQHGAPVTAFTMDLGGASILEHVHCAGARLANVSARRGTNVIDFTAWHPGSFDGAALDMKLRRGKEEVSYLRGSPICAIPHELPQVLTPYGPGVAEELGPPRSVIAAPRVSVLAPLEKLAGTVRDDLGRYLTVAMPLMPALEKVTWYHDDHLVICGNDSACFGEQRKASLRTRLLDILAFFGEELGHGDRIRLLAICTSGAHGYAGKTGYFSGLDDTFLTSKADGSYAGEGVLARQLAGLWWGNGVRPAGAFGADFALGLATFCGMRWQSASWGTAAMEKEVQFVQRMRTKIEAAGITTNPEGYRAADLALALHDAAREGKEVSAELRRWCMEWWGYSVPVRDLLRSLERIGVAVSRLGWE